MRTDAVELEQIKDGLEQTGRRYTAPNLEGAVLDCDHALYEGGFRRPVVKTSTERGTMVIYRSHPLWEAATTDRIVSRLEKVWARHGAFQHEAHSVNVSGDRVLFDLVTWWDDGTFYTGRIEIEPTTQALDEKRPAVRPKP